MRKEVFGVKKRRSSKPTFIDLFAGCGGLSLGLMEAGWKGLFAIEKDKMAFETLKHNMTGKTGKNYFNWPKWLHRNLHEISDFNKQYKKNLLGLRGKVDLVAGGPPCQGFSLAGKRSKRDPRNQLFKEYINFLELVQPSICLIENVPGINIGLGKESSLLNGSSYQSIPIAYSTHIKKRLEEIGYRVVFFNIIRAVDCGVPQYRPRFFIIALKKDLSMHIDEESITGMIKKYQNKILKSLKLRTKPDITVADFFPSFLARFSSWKKINQASKKDLEEFLRPIGLWKRRASSLKKLATEMTRANGRFPKSRRKIEALPGVGQYIANAILMFCHGEPQPLLDTNMARVLERYFGEPV